MIAAAHEQQEPSHTPSSKSHMHWTPLVVQWISHAGDAGSVPGLGRFHMLWSNQAVCQLLEPTVQSPGSTASEPGCHSY